MSTILKPITIGKFLRGGDINWLWYHPHHNRLAIIGDNNITPKRKLLKNLAQLVQSRDAKSVYWITGEEELETLAEVHSSDAIYWIESIPDPPLEMFDDSHIFINNRKFFSSAYLQLLAKAKNMKRVDLLPPSSYKSEEEGPLIGYIRTAESLEDSENKDWLLTKLKELKNIKWYYSKKEGKKFYIPRQASLIEKAISFLEGVWSWYAITAKIDAPQQLLMIVEPPKELLREDTPEDVRNIVEQALNILPYLATELTMTLILSSELLFPIDQQNYRYNLFLPIQDSDIDYYHPETRTAMRAEELFASWEKGRTDAGYFYDRVGDDAYLGYFTGDNLKFLDDFVMPRY